MVIARTTLTALGHGLLVGLVMSGLTASAGDQLTQAVAGLRARLHSADLRKLIDAQAPGLTSQNPKEQEQAILFFYDLRAKDVLLALVVREEVPGAGISQWSIHTRACVAVNCLDLFDVRDMPLLYDVAATTVWVWRDTGERAAGALRVKMEVARRLCELLGAPCLLRSVSEWERDPTLMSSWWLARIQEAKGKPGYVPELDSLQKAMEQRLAEEQAAKERRTKQE